MTDNRFLSRKFWMAVGLTAVASVFLWFGKIDPQTWGMVVSLNAGQYTAGNVFAGKRKEKT